MEEDGYVHVLMILYSRWCLPCASRLGSGSREAWIVGVVCLGCVIRLLDTIASGGGRNSIYSKSVPHTALCTANNTIHPHALHVWWHFFIFRCLF